MDLLLVKALTAKTVRLDASTQRYTRKFMKTIRNFSKGKKSSILKLWASAQT